MEVSLFAELQRRRVFRALVGYGIAAFAVLQIIEPIMHGLHWPDEVLSYTVVALAVGFPIVVSLAWIFDVNAGRIERTAPASTGPKGARLGFLLVGVGVLAATPGVIWYFVVRSPARSVASSATVTERVTPSIAVLPFADMSPGHDQEYFSDGIAEEILNALAQVEGLRVIGRTSSFSFKGKTEDLRAIGEKLGVANVLEGSVRKEGNRLRITAQLIAAANGSHIWSRAFERERAGVFAMQDEIAKAVVEALKLKLLNEQSSGRRTANPEVYNQYLLGRQFLNRSSPDSVPSAVSAFEKTIAMDPNYAPAWAGLAQARWYAARWLDGTAAEITTRQEGSLAAAERAIALAPDLADGWSARGRVRSVFRYDWKGGLADMEHALALNPSDVATLSAYALDVLLPLGRLAETVAAARKATVVGPLDTGSWAVLGVSLYTSGELPEARKALTRALEINPQNDWAAMHLGFVDLLAGRPAVARDAFKRNPSEWMRQDGLALAEYDLGHLRESQQALDVLMGPLREQAAYQVAEVYAHRGEVDAAFAWLERGYDQHDTGLRWLKVDSFLGALRGDPRYTALLKKMNLPVD